MSRSCVALGRPCAASAWAPTTRKRTRWEINESISSLHSGGSFIVDAHRGFADGFDGRHSIGDAEAAPIAAFGARRLFRCRPAVPLHELSVAHVGDARKPTCSGHAPRGYFL